MDEYISREAVVRYLKGYSEKELNKNSPFGMITSSVLDKAERAISEMPAADVQSVKHGRWIVAEDGYTRCYTCGMANDDETEYCPHCGRKMDGDSE